MTHCVISKRSQWSEGFRGAETCVPTGHVAFPNTWFHHALFILFWQFIPGEIKLLFAVICDRDCTRSLHIHRSQSIWKIRYEELIVSSKHIQSCSGTNSHLWRCASAGSDSNSWGNQAQFTLHAGATACGISSASPLRQTSSPNAVTWADHPTSMGLTVLTYPETAVCQVGKGNCTSPSNYKWLRVL